MKFSLFKNDKSTVKDEIALLLIILVFLACSILLMVFKPSFWLIEESHSVTAGLLLLMMSIMLIPSFILRLTENEPKEKKK